MNERAEMAGLRVVDATPSKDSIIAQLRERVQELKRQLALHEIEAEQIDEWRLDSRELREIRAELGVPTWQTTLEAIRRLVR